MSPIKNVVLIGAGGNLGPSVLKALLDAKFAVSILARQESKSTFPAGVPVHRTDYSSESLVKIFSGQDAVVSTLGSSGLPEQKTIIDAAITAKVQRFLPSEFGSNTENAKALATVPFFHGKVEITDYLSKAAANHPTFSWTAIATGAFLDWGLTNGFLGYDIPNRKATIYDAGDRRLSLTTLANVGDAVVGTLLHPAETANRHVYVHSVTVTQNELLAALEAATGAKFAVTKRATADAAREGAAKLAAGDIPGAVYDLLLANAYSPGTGNDFENDVPNGVDNARLGVPAVTLEKVVKDVVAA